MLSIYVCLFFLCVRVYANTCACVCVCVRTCIKALATLLYVFVMYYYSRLFFFRYEVNVGRMSLIAGGLNRSPLEDCSCGGFCFCVAFAVLWFNLVTSGKLQKVFIVATHGDKVDKTTEDAVLAVIKKVKVEFKDVLDFHSAFVLDARSSSSAEMNVLGNRFAEVGKELLEVRNDVMILTIDNINVNLEALLLFVVV